MTINRNDLDRSQELQDRIIQLWECPVEFGSLWHRGVLQTDGTRRKRYGALHKDIAAHALSSNRTSTIVSRNHGKTTIFMDIALWSKWRHMDKRIMYMSASTQLACEILGELRAVTEGEIELLPGLMVPFRECFPELVPVKAPAGSPPASFNVAGRTGTGREPCFFPSSIGSNKAGKHPTDIFVDDPANEKNSTTPTQREKVIHAMKQLEPILRDPQDGAIRHIGTPWAFQDVTAWLGRNSEYTQFRFGAWNGVNPDTGSADGCGPGEDGAWPLCPDYMNAGELLEAESLIDDHEFWAQQYLCQPVAAANALFTDSMFQVAEQKVSDIGQLPEGKRVLLWDPTSRADARTGDWNGIVVVHITTAGHLIAACKDNPAFAVPGIAEVPHDTNYFFPIEAHEIKGPPGECMELVEDIHQRLRLSAIWVEDTGSAGALVPWFHQKHWTRKDKVAIVPVKIGTKSNKAQRLQGIQLGFKEGRIRVLRDFPGRDNLLKRLAEFPKSESDDIPDALALLTTHIMRRGKIPGISLEKSEEIYYNAAADPSSLKYRPPSTQSSSW